MLQTGAGRLDVRDSEGMEQYRRGEMVFDVIDAGPADAPVVVLLHGFPEQNTVWHPIISRLTAEGYRCVAPNQRGYSAGARPTRRRDYRISELADDVLALIEASGARRVHLVGHDWGANVAWTVAQRYPERLSTVSPVSVPHPGAFLKALLTSRQALASWYMLFCQLPRVPEWYLTHGRGEFTMAAITKARSQHSAASAQREAKAMAEPRALTAAINWYRGMPFSDMRQAGTKVTVPTLFIWSDNDIALLRKGADLCGRYVKGEYRFEILHGVSHWIVDERPDAVADLLLDWFAAHPTS